MVRSDAVAAVFGGGPLSRRSIRNGGDKWSRSIGRIIISERYIRIVKFTSVLFPSRELRYLIRLGYGAVRTGANVKPRPTDGNEEKPFLEGGRPSPPSEGSATRRKSFLRLLSDLARGTRRSEEEEMSEQSSSRASFGKLNPLSKPKTVRVMVLGQEGVGKSALVVRFITRRFIGEYDRNLEKVYSFQTSMDNESVSFEILDTVGQPQDEGCLLRESNIRWAEAFILMYSVTDKCSFEDCTRLKFLVNYNKRRKRLGSECKDAAMDVPVLLIGNKTDLARDRMVSKEEGLKRSKDIGCVCFHEISVRESVDQVRYVFRDVFHFWKAHKKLSKLKRSSSESENGSRSCAEHRGVPCSSKSPSPSAGGSDCTLTGNSSLDLDESIKLLRDVHAERHRKDALFHTLDLPPFRSRAQTDGILSSRCSTKTSAGLCRLSRQRRMSISMKGKTSSC